MISSAAPNLQLKAGHRLQSSHSHMYIERVERTDYLINGQKSGIYSEHITVWQVGVPGTLYDGDGYPPIPGPGSDFVSISIWPTRVLGFGHTGINVDTDDTQGFSTNDPSTPWYKRLFGTPAGRLENDIFMHTDANGNVAPHYYIHIPISPGQADAMRAAMAKRETPQGAGFYNLLFRNCDGFVESVLHAGGVGGVPNGMIFVPNVLGLILGYENSFR